MQSNVYAVDEAQSISTFLNQLFVIPFPRAATTNINT